MLRRAGLASFMGTCVEWFDYASYGFLANGGTLPTFLCELFPTGVRFSGFALSFNAANALFGGTAPLIATWLIGATGSKTAPAWFMVAAATLVAIAMSTAGRAGSALRDE